MQENPAVQDRETVGDADEACTAGRVRATGPVVAYFYEKVITAEPAAYPRGGRSTVLGDVGRGLKDNEEGGRLNRGGGPAGQFDVDIYRNDRTPRHIPHRRRQPEVGEDLRVNVVDQLAEL